MKLWTRRAIAIVAIVGGLIGMFSAAMLIASLSSSLDRILVGGFLLIYAWGVWNGMRWLRRRTGGERAMLAFWLIQIPAIQSPIASYFLACGLHLTASLQPSPLAVNGSFLFGSTFNYSLGKAATPWVIGVNVFAALITWSIARDLPRSRR